MLAFIRSSPLFSLQRLIFCLILTAFVVSTDILFFHILDIQTTADTIYEVTINTLGAYGGFTIMALFNQPSSSR
jgi:glycopeptide antibiotics resistance protein